MKEKEWDEYVKRSKTWAIRVGYDLLHSVAFQGLTYAPAVKVLFWFHEKIRMRKVNRRKRGMERYERIDTKITFTYAEGRRRGLTDQQFSRALKELYARGFIDIKEHGEGLMGDYTVYSISERWREFGTRNFKCLEFPKSNYFGYRRMKKNKTNDEKSPLANDGISMLETPFNGEHSMLKKQVLPNPQR